MGFKNRLHLAYTHLYHVKNTYSYYNGTDRTLAHLLDTKKSEPIHFINLTNGLL